MNLLDQTLASIRSPDVTSANVSAMRLDTLTKPLGSLGRLEELVRRYASIRRDPAAQMRRGAIALFVADHGVAAEGVSAYPQSVTLEMLRNFSAGGAAISVLARRFNYDLLVIDVGVATDSSKDPLPGVKYCRLGSGTANLARRAAMSSDQLRKALELGIETAIALADSGATLIGVGEMGIANSTSAAALLCAITGLAPMSVVGRGTGLDDRGLALKIGVVERALDLHREVLTDGVATLAALGGFEIAAMAGACLGGAARSVPIVIDGFIATAAAAAASRLYPAIFEHLFFSHCSAEGGHRAVLNALGVRPLFDLEMRLGEGTGAALAMNMIESALELFCRMSTFDSAAVSDRVR